MNDLDFDENGYLTPYDIIDIDWLHLEETFVFSSVRTTIFIQFKKLVAELTAIGGKKFDIWIDGSFASTKTSPNDMDLVCFVDEADYDRYQKELVAMRKNFSLLDIYFVKVYPQEHSSYFLTNFDKLDWLHFFSRDRQNRKKGILKIRIEL
ncbi:DUF6932 family protein [Dyadobacter sp. CY326]|uniref:DUF6932 family protein n=1 Tax=Dyadobacter sp. CY326 TaxID=2907300 RepID=UPI001F3DDF11|nr:hypothetical protein [Dyadobacter sp. CY326]MCE7066277.1 hypothetical protein [Dyadobacter sp. CY326]